MDENFNDSAPDRAEYKIGVFKWLSKDETQCVKCSRDDQPKIIKTTKSAYQNLVKHLRKYHKEEHKKYEQLTKDRPNNTIPRYFASGSLSAFDRKIINYVAANYCSFNSLKHPTFKVQTKEHLRSVVWC